MMVVTSENILDIHSLTPTSQKIAELSIVVDKMHMAGHIDSWCKKKKL